MKHQSEFSGLVQLHRDLEAQIQDNRSNFLSDWNCDNPLVDHLLGPDLAAIPRGGCSRESYVYFDAEGSLLRTICSFHSRVEELPLSSRNVVAGPGSSSFLTAFAIWLRRSGYEHVYYIPPLYHTFYFILESLGIQMTAVAAKHAFEDDFSMSLPPEHSVLLLCDPVWYAGKSVPITHLSTISAWQRDTKSLVFVDGSFQYMKWNLERSEATAMLDQELTFRLICPAKALAVPFHRFAYLLHPSTVHDELLFLYESLVGGANASDLAFAQRAMEVLSGDGTIERLLPELLARTFEQLVDHGLVQTTIVPDGGYFAFAVPIVQPDGLECMDERYFELRGHPGYCRVNLLAARRIYNLDPLI